MTAKTHRKEKWLVTAKSHRPHSLAERRTDRGVTMACRWATWFP